MLRIMLNYDTLKAQDPLIYNFYVDADRFPAFVKQATISKNGQADRSEPATYEVSFATPGPLQQPGDHVVEVLVADGALVNRDPQPRVVTLLDGGTALDPSYAVTYAWRRMPSVMQRSLQSLDALGSRPRAAVFGHTLMLIARRPQT